MSSWERESGWTRDEPAPAYRNPLMEILSAVPEERGIELTREQLNDWAGRILTDGEIEALDEAIPNSSIPEAIATIADTLPYRDDD